jgi:hypothetical protein
MIPAWLEALIPLGIIATAVAGMGGLQGGVHHLFFGKPKAIGQDDWDRLIVQRDEQLKKQQGSFASGT